jgi:hypothetical protein
MAIFTTADGRQIVGAAQAGNEYKGYAGRREIVIQLTATGATQDSLDALEFLKSYAVYNNSVGEPIFPASTNVFISNNGVTKAVEADEVTVDGANVNIGGCVWNGTAWDFTNAGQGGGGGSSGGGVLVVNVTETESDTHDIYTCDKTAGEILSALEEKAVIFKYEYGYIESCVGGGQHLDGYQFVRGGTSASDVQFTALAITDYPSFQD